MNRISKMLSIVALSASISACAVNPRQSMIDNGYPPQYADGYIDGCASGKNAAGSWVDPFKKDISRFDIDKTYAQGWTDGFNVCKGRSESIDRILLQ